MIKQVPGDDETSRQHKERLQYKITTAAQTFLVKNALLEDRNQLLTNINDEGKLSRSAKSETLGKVRAMSFENLERARAERAVKEAAKQAKKVAKEAKMAAKEAKNIATAGKGIRGRQRKSPEEASVPEPKVKVARMSEAQIEEDEIAPEPWRAPVARMW
ncbi:hypothetical protein MMC21_007309 [Puttea exsequens]|nr:hypothetical protein [Puttea exsequens]